ncbi:Sugar transporter SWEET, partial [Operophtera brumata]
MYLSDFKGFVGTLAVATTVLQFLSGILVCKQYYVNKTTAESSPLPFLCGLLSAGLWLLYGLTKHDDKIIFVNIIGIVLMLLYVIVFYKYTLKKSSLLKQTCLSACSLTVLTIAAPMSKLLYVIKYKNTDCLPFPMILMSCFVSTLWLLY